MLKYPDQPGMWAFKGYHEGSVDLVKEFHNVIGLNDELVILDFPDAQEASGEWIKVDFPWDVNLNLHLLRSTIAVAWALAISEHKQVDDATMLKRIANYLRRMGAEDKLLELAFQGVPISPNADVKLCALCNDVLEEPSYCETCFQTMKDPNYV